MMEYQVLREILGPDTDGGYCFTPEVCISPDRMGALMVICSELTSVLLSNCIDNEYLLIQISKLLGLIALFVRESTNPSSMKSPY